MELEDIVNLVQTKPKFVAMKAIYKAFDVKKDDRPKWLELWDDIKEQTSASDGEGSQNKSQDA